MLKRIVIKLRNERVLFSTALLLFFPFLGLSQTTITIKDSITKVKLPFATLESNGRIIYSNTEGEVKLNSEDSLMNVSYIGYKSVLNFNVKRNETIELAPLVNNLDEVEISAFREKFSVGFHNLKSYGYLSGERGDFHAIVLPRINQSAYLSCIRLHFKKIKKASVYYVYLFERTEYGKPGNLIRFFEVRSSTSKGKVSLNVENYNIVYPNSGLAIGYRTEPTQPRELIPDLRMTNAKEIKSRYIFYEQSWQQLDTPDFPFVNYKIGVELIPF